MEAVEGGSAAGGEQDVRVGAEKRQARPPQAGQVKRVGHLEQLRSGGEAQLRQHRRLAQPLQGRHAPVVGIRVGATVIGGGRR